MRSPNFDPNSPQPSHLTFRSRRSRRIWQRRLRVVKIGLALCLGTWLLLTATALGLAARMPVDAVLVLGGSIQREMYVAELAHQSPDVPILISHGSEDPCILLLFQRVNAPIHQVWLEKCAESTFENFYFSVPTLERWGVHKVKLVTSESHLPRAQWLAQIMLGAHGIWVVPDVVQEKGVPGNQESRLKTGLDLVRGLGWAIASQFYRPTCSQLVPLSTVNLEYWQNQGFDCEHQAGLDL